MKDHCDKIIILTMNPFPIGLAGTNRILSYCTGFLQNGFQSEIVCVRPTEPYDNVFNNIAKGSHKGIIFSYPGGTTIRANSFWKRRLNDFNGIFRSIIKVRSLISSGEVAFLVFYGNYFITELICVFLARIYHKKIYKEENEHPDVLLSRGNSIQAKVNRWIYLNVVYRIYSGILVMTNPLKDFFIENGIKVQKILVVPQTVEVERFEESTITLSLNDSIDYIAYIGSYNQRKDGVLTLIEAYKDLLRDYPNIKLVIAGEGTCEEESSILKLISKLGLKEEINLIGRIPSEEIPPFLLHAKVLISCRPQSLQSDYGFPTKVVEYLASGRPMITTATGELSSFLEDRGNAYILERLEPEIVAAKILEVLEEYELALKIAQKGKDLVKVSFNPFIQAKKIIDFYKS